LRAASDEFPAERWRLIDNWEYAFHANWKIPVENTIESYHVSKVHPKTLVRFGTEEEMTHLMYDNGTVMKSPIAAPAFYYRLANWLLPLLEPECSHQYRLHHVFPNLFLIRIDAMLQVMTVIPTSANTCRLTVQVFVLRAARETLRSRLMTYGWGRFKTWIIRKVLAEDAPLYPDLHAGMKASPFQGTISTREELVFAFQDYVRKQCEAVAREGEYRTGNACAEPRE
jgi:phenylpropionate dioxygenase-like ring-hydroxylating dioxygenase large terminal subunit